MVVMFHRDDGSVVKVGKNLSLTLCLAVRWMRSSCGMHAKAAHKTLNLNGPDLLFSLFSVFSGKASENAV